MNTVDLTGALAESASEVLEIMYFTGVTGSEEPAPSPEGEWICARLDFQGGRSGSLGVRAPLPTARVLAESFLGAEPETVTELQCVEVLGEMTNMICGNVLSRLAKEELFALSHPQPEPPDWNGQWGNHTVASIFQLDDGALGVWLDWETA
jgi:CheY-specific phosphatase CheX